MHEHTPKKLGFAGRVSELFLRHREFSVLTIIVLASWGLLSFVLTPKQYNPDIVAPAFSIVTEFPNASASEVYEFITRPMEDKLSELPEVDEISSESYPGGRSVVVAKFFIGSDREAAKVTLNQKLRDNINLKPVGAYEPVIVSIDPDDVAILDLGLVSDTLSESSLRKLGTDVADELKLVPGVSRVELKGGRVNHLQVEIDAGRLDAHGLSVEQVSGAIASANAVFTVDTLEGDTRNPVVNVSGNIRSEDDLRDLVLAQGGDAIVRLGDVATVSYGPGEITNFVRLGDRQGDVPVVHIALSKLRGTNATSVSRAVLAKAEELESGMIPDGVTLRVLRDEGKTAQEEIGKLSGNLFQSIAIVGIVLYAFLGFRNAIVVALSIPLTLLSVFAAGLLAGQTVNRITLFALILSLGLLVDSATVVVENINRFLRARPEGDRIRTIAEAVDEVGMGLVMSTVTTLFAFFPMAFVTGMMGPYMGPIPFFVPAALIASLLIAFTINPFLASVFSSGEGTADRPKRENIFIRAVHRVEDVYERTLSRMLAHPRTRRKVLFGALALLLFSLALPGTGIVPFRMLPKADKEQFYVYLDLPQGTDVSRTEAASVAVSETLLSDPEVEYAARFVGESQVIDFNGLFKGSGARVGEHQATVKAGLTRPDERDETSEEIATRVRSALSDVTLEYPDLSVQIVEDPPGPPVLATFLLKVKGDDESLREAIAADFERTVRGIDGMTDIETTVPERSVHYVYEVDTDKAELLGVAPAQISPVLRTALSGVSAGLFHQSEEGGRKAEQEFIVVRFDAESRDSVDDLSKIMLHAEDGTAVPLSELIREVPETVPYPIASDERRRVTNVSAELEGRSVIYAVLDLFPKLLSYELPDVESRLVSWSPMGAEYEVVGTGERYRIELGGEWKLTLEVFRDLGIAMGVAIFLIYFVLVAQFRSLKIPLLVMATIPLALIGVLPGFAVLYAVKGTYFNATSMIGVIALAGIVVNNAIIYLEYVNELKEDGVPLRQALVSAGRTRLLPILLTSVTTILGSLTIVSDPVWEGLAWAIIFGLSVSTFLTLVIFPLLYFVFERKLWTNSGILES